MREFVNLHSHTALGSMLDALVSVDELFQRAKELEQKSIAITDHGSLAALFDAYKVSKKTGVKLIPGTEAYFVNSFAEIKNDNGRGTRYEKNKHLVLLAKNHEGYKNLLKLNYIGFQNQAVIIGKIFPRINFEILKQNCSGLVCTSACINGPISILIRNEMDDEAEELAQNFQQLFGDDFYIEIHVQHIKNDNLDQEYVNRKLINIAQKYGIPLTCAIDSHYLIKEDEKYHDVLLAINDKVATDDPNRRRYGASEFYMKSGDEVYSFLEKYYGTEIAEEAVNNTVKIAAKCEEPTYMEKKNNHLPVFDIQSEPDYGEFLIWKEKANLINLREDCAFMRYRVFKGFNERFKNLPEDQKKIRLERIKNEIRVLEKNNFSSYMLVVSDFIKWARDHEIMVGCGRGSVGGSLTAHLLGIHMVDPLNYGLLFERFQNAEKKDLPDIDTDFISAGRDLVQEYCFSKYGKDRCAHVSNIVCYTPKNTIPDLVRSLRNELPELIPEGSNYVSISEQIKDAIPEVNEYGEPIETIDQALRMSAKLRTYAEKCPRLLKYAEKFIGMPKEWGTHAAGIVISDISINDFAPLRIDKNGATAVQYEKHRCEEAGLVKMDFLSLSTLDIIAETFKNIKRLGINGPQKVEDIPLDDTKTYEIIQRGETGCIFQLGKSGMMVSLCKAIKPKSILDIACINALGRPSCSKEERISFADVRAGKKSVSFLHPSLENSFKDTCGIGIFEEQLMTVARDVAGWNLNKADGLRKLTKLKGKDPQMVLDLEKDFINGAIKTHNMSYEEAKNIWDKIILPFSAYGFNKSHAVLYSINSYYTAYLKAHFPACFLAAYLKIRTNKNNLSKDEEITVAKSECKRLGIKILAPDINKSSSNYEVLDENTIVMGFAAIKGLGEKAVQELCLKQPFENFTDFVSKTDGRVINKAKMEALSKAGCFDSFDVTRQDIAEECKKVRDKYNAWVKKQADGYSTIFSYPFSGNEWGKQQKLRYELEVLGEMVSGTIQDLFPGFFNSIDTVNLGRLKSFPDRHEIKVEVMVQKILREFKIKTGKYAGQMMIKYLVFDPKDPLNNLIELTVWPSEYERAKKMIKEGMPLKCIAQVSVFNQAHTLMLRKVERIYGT